MFDIDLQSRTPIYEQLYKRVIAMTVRRELNAGDRLPSVRELAKELGVNPNTVSKAFQMLERDGLVNTLPGRGSFIAGENGEAVMRISRENFSKAVKEAYNSGFSENDLIDEVKETVKREKEKGDNS
ncbi:MAG: GntR family transcriptional regulator [Ruminococcus sp.]|nr:GntR family transcriptional regulator [Ruminococcus sp.]